MSTFTIKIDRRSIRRNKTYRPPHKPRLSYSGERLTIKDGVWVVESFTAKRCKIIADPDMGLQIKAWGLKVTGDRKAQDQDFRKQDPHGSWTCCLDTPVARASRTKACDGKVISLVIHRMEIKESEIEQYRYRYQKSKVTCNGCHETFPHSSLRDGDGGEGCSCCGRGYDGYSNRVCPHCFEWDCCEIENEVLSTKALAQCARRNEERAKRRKK